MKVVFSDLDFTRVGLMKSVLDAAGIACYIQNQHTHTLVSSMPIELFYPKLCVVDDGDEVEALGLIGQVMGSRHPDADLDLQWQCVGCGEMVPEVFGSCWNCELVRESGDFDV